MEENLIKDLSKRIGQVLESHAYANQSKLAKDLGMNTRTVNLYLTGKAKPSVEFLMKILAVYPTISSDWLLCGKGAMYSLVMEHAEKNALLHRERKERELILDTIAGNIQSAITSALNRKENVVVTTHPAILTDNPKEGIPLIPLSAMAGAFTGEQQILEYECERYDVPMFKGADFLIPVKGSSMYPKYNSGDIVACKRLPMSNLFFQWNKVYVLDTDQGALIKRIQEGSDKENVRIVSDNEKYTPFELPLSSIYNVALVIGVIRLE